MTAIWVLVADSSRARIFATDRPKGDLQEIASFEHPESRMHERELTSDLPGRAFDSGGQGRHVMGTPVEPKQQEAVQFAKKVSGYLENARNRGAFSKLYVAAAPAFLGLLRDNYSATLLSLIAQEWDKDLIGLRADELRKHLPERL